MNGIQYTICKTTSMSTTTLFRTGPEQGFEIWYDRDGFWLDLEDVVIDGLDRLPTQLVTRIKYEPGELPDNALGDTMILVLGLPGHNIAPAVIGLVRAEYDELQAEIANPGYAGILGPTNQVAS